jgi:hypothetical protein
MNYCIVIPLYQNEITALIYNRNETIVIIIYIYIYIYILDLLFMMKTQKRGDYVLLLQQKRQSSRRSTIACNLPCMFFFFLCHHSPFLRPRLVHLPGKQLSRRFAPPPHPTVSSSCNAPPSIPRRCPAATRLCCWAYTVNDEY